jgi:hypothetical protein
MGQSSSEVVMVRFTVWSRQRETFVGRLRVMASSTTIPVLMNLECILVTKMETFTKSTTLEIFSGLLKLKTNLADDVCFTKIWFLQVRGTTTFMV